MNTYLPVWNKYRPAIIRMMINSNVEPQQYKMSKHEFQAMDAKQRGTYNFTLQVSKGKAINNIKDSVIAQGLLEVLLLSQKAKELSDAAAYEIMMDRQFVLHVRVAEGIN